MNPLETRIEELSRRYPIRLLLQFGSSVTGRTHSHSDVDLAVSLDRPFRSFEERGELMGALQSLFPDREVDIAFLDRADPLLLRKITENCRLLYGREGDFHQFRIYAFKRYQDHRRYLDLERQFVERSIAGGQV